MTVKKIFYFLEDFDRSLDYSDGKIISLYPHVSFQLGERGMGYSILEDYYDQVKMRELEFEMFDEQIEWINRFDALLRNNIRFCEENKFAVVRIYFNKIKYFIGTLVAQSFILHEFISKNGPCEIRYVFDSSKRRKTTVIHYFNQWVRTKFIKDILYVLSSKDQSLEYKDYGFNTNSGVNDPEGASARSGNPAIVPVKIIKRFLKLLFHLKKYSKFSNIQTRHKNDLERLSVLFLHSGNAVTDLIMKESIKAGASVWYVSEGRISSLNDIGEIVKFNMNDAKKFCRYDEIKEDSARAFESFCKNEDLIPWVSEKCGIDAGDIIGPFLRNFVEELCPEIISKAGLYMNFYRSNKIKCIVATNVSDINAKCAILAANSAGVKRVGFQHGVDICDNPNWLIDDIDNFEHYFASNPLSEYIFKEGFGKWGVKSCKLYQMPHMYTMISGQKIGQQKTSGNKNKKTILFVPASKANVHSRCFRLPTYQVMWYYEIQKIIVDYFVERAEFDFIYKHARTTREWADLSIIPYINRKKSMNVRVETDTLRNYYGKVDAVILDRPTGSLFESSGFDVPLLCVYPDFIDGQIAEKAKNIFGNVLRSFSSPDEVLEKINNFLSALNNGKAGTYKAKLDYRQDDVLPVMLNGNVLDKAEAGV